MKSIPRFRGPSLILLATVHFLIFVAGLVTASALRHGAHFVTPFSSAEELRTFLALSPTAVRVSNFFLFASAIPFGIFAVTVVSRLRFMGVRAAGTNIALLGGLIATIALILSGSVGWILSVPEVLASAQVVKAITFLNFLLGGVVFAVGFGLLAAGGLSPATSCGFFRVGWSPSECSWHSQGKPPPLASLHFRQTSLSPSPGTWASSGCFQSP